MLKVFLVIVLTFCLACGDLEKKLRMIEQKVLDETAFGRQMRDYTQSKNTRYIVDKTLSYPARYSTAKDSIYYNPKFNPTLKRWKSELLQGRPVGTILNFHEELHRTQVAFSERGSFFRFFRENGRIEENILPNDRVQYDFRIELQEGDEGKVLQFAGSLVGYPILDLQKAGEIVRKKIDEMNTQNPEKLLGVKGYIDDVLIDDGSALKRNKINIAPTGGVSLGVFCVHAVFDYVVITGDDIPSNELSLISHGKLAKTWSKIKVGD